MPDAGGEIADLTERIKQRDALEASTPVRLRDAVRVLAPLIHELPSTEIYLLMPQAVAAWRTLRDEDADTFLVYVGAIRQKCGGVVAQVLTNRVGSPSTTPRRELHMLTVHELMGAEASPDYVASLIPTDAFGTIIGESSSGKSFFGDSLLLAGARGSTWFDWELPQAGAIIIGLEGRRKNRVGAYCAYHEIAEADLDASTRFLETQVDLCGTTPDLERLLPLVRQAREEIGLPCNVLIDTHSRAMAGHEENSSGDTNAAVNSYACIREAAGGIVMATHHTGKDPAKGGRGSTALRAAVDFEILIERQPSGIRTATFTKVRDGESGRVLAFRLEPHASSCVVVPCTADGVRKPPEQQRKLGADESIALDTLKEEIAANGEMLPETSELPGNRRGVKVEAWRGRFYARLGETRDISTDATRKAFTRGLKGLVSRKLIGVGGLHAWIW